MKNNKLRGRFSSFNCALSTPPRGGRARWLPLALALAVNAALPVAVAGEDTSGAIHIQAQPLASALSQWAQQTALQVFFNPDMVAGKQAPAVNGKLSAQEALAQLLQGSGLSYALDGDAVTLREAPVSHARQPAAPLNWPRWM